MEDLDPRVGDIAAAGGHRLVEAGGAGRPPRAPQPGGGGLARPPGAGGGGRGRAGAGGGGGGGGGGGRRGGGGPRREPWNPASRARRLTTAAALDRRGPAWGWRTPVWLDGPLRDGVLDGSLVIQGSGDPTLVLERVWLLLRRVQALGVREIRGDIVLDGSAFAVAEADPGDFDGEALRPYNVRPAALLLNFRSVIYTFVPDAAAGLAHVVAEPPLPAEPPLAPEPELPPVPGPTASSSPQAVTMAIAHAIAPMLTVRFIIVSGRDPLRVATLREKRGLTARRGQVS